MKLTLDDYADLIIANVYGGYKGITNISLSKEAVKDEFVLTSRRFIKELFSKEQVELEEFFQTIPKIKLTPLEDQASVPVILIGKNTKLKIFHAEIPELLWVTGIDPVDYIGPFNRYYQYIVKKGNSFVQQQHSKYHSEEPTVWVKGKDLYVANNLKNVTYLQMRAILKDPTEFLIETDPFPMPSDVADMVITKMTDQYLRYYRMRNPSPNTQNDIQQFPTSERGDS